jgi:phosphoserine phosphatase
MPGELTPDERSNMEAFSDAIRAPPLTPSAFFTDAAAFVKTNLGSPRPAWATDSLADALQTMLEPTSLMLETSDSDNRYVEKVAHELMRGDLIRIRPQETISADVLLLKGKTGKHSAAPKSSWSSLLTMYESDPATALGQEFYIHAGYVVEKVTADCVGEVIAPFMSSVEGKRRRNLPPPPAPDSNPTPKLKAELDKLFTESNLLVKPHGDVNDLTRVTDLCDPETPITVVFDKTGTLSTSRMEVFALSSCKESEDGNTQDFHIHHHSSLEPKFLNSCLRTLAGCSGQGVEVSGDTQAIQRFVRGCAPDVAYEGHSSIIMGGVAPIAVRPFNKKYMLSACAFDVESGATTDDDPVTRGSKFACFMGAPSILLEHCAEILIEDTEEHTSFSAELSDEKKKTILDECDKLAKDGMRVIAFAQRAIDDSLLEVMKDHESMFWGTHDWTFVCTVAMNDPPREEAAEVIQNLVGDLGCKVVVCSGDSATTTRSFAASVSIPGADKATAVCSDVETSGFSQCNEDTVVFGRMNENNKADVVNWLKAPWFDGRLTKVIYVGDGSGDAPALRACDFGFVVEDCGLLVRRDCDAILLKNDLHGVVAFVKLCRNGGHMVKVEAPPLPPPETPVPVRQPEPAAAPPPPEIKGGGCCVVS